jgi:hypothetical protein
MSTFLTKKLDTKSIVWFKTTNSYFVFESIIAKILTQIRNNVKFVEIEDFCSKNLDAPREVILNLTTCIYKIYIENNFALPQKADIKIQYKIPTLFFSEKYYYIHNYIIRIQYQKEYLESKIHPIFAHLELKKTSNYHFNYTVFSQNSSIFFLKNMHYIGHWNKRDTHLFEGKLSMQLLIDIYKKPETDWMGVFHASAISNGKESILLLGDSGNGKSTSLALLIANGFNCLADDFVPIDKNKNIYTYPAAISVKKNSVATLIPFYPQLKNTSEFHLKKRNTTVKYLAPKKIDYSQKTKCKALIFIKYNPKIELEINTKPQIEAFQQLVPDSWISPIEENVDIFLDWFLELPCYQLTYSNNKKMIDTVSKIFQNEL